MRRTSQIRLVLLGGGVALMLAGCGESAQERECREAREQRRPDAEQICARSTRSSSGSTRWGGSSWFFGRSAGARTDASLRNAGTNSASARGGFGSSVRSFFSSRS